MKINENNKMDVAKFCEIVQLDYSNTKAKLESSIVFEIVRVIRDTHVYEHVIALWAAANVNHELLLKIHPFVKEKVVEAAISPKEPCRNFQNYFGQAFVVAKEEILRERNLLSNKSTEQVVEAVAIKQVCSKCNHEVKERALFFGTYFGCMC